MTAPGTDGGLVTQHQLSLGFALGAPSLPGLQIAGGTLQLGHLSVFGDVAADSRTTLSNLALALPMDRRDLTFPDAPYGLYSRVQAGPLDLHLKGSWRGTPLEIEVEGVDPGLDLRGPALDYSPEQSAHFGILIDTTVWFDAQALDDATVSFGKIRVEDGQNAGLGALFRANLRASFSLDPAAAAL